LIFNDFNRLDVNLASRRFHFAPEGARILAATAQFQRLRRRNLSKLALLLTPLSPRWPFFAPASRVAKRRGSGKITPLHPEKQNTMRRRSAQANIVASARHSRRGEPL